MLLKSLFAGISPISSTVLTPMTEVYVPYICTCHTALCSGTKLLHNIINCDPTSSALQAACECQCAVSNITHLPLLCESREEFLVQDIQLHNSRCTQEMSDLPFPVSTWIMQCSCAWEEDISSCVLPSLLCKTSAGNYEMTFSRNSPESLPAEFLGIRSSSVSGLLNLHVSELKTLSFQKQI